MECGLSSTGFGTNQSLKQYEHWFLVETVERACQPKGKVLQEAIFLTF